MSVPALLVGLDHLFNACFFNCLKEAAAEHVDCFALAGGIQEGGLASGDLLQLCHGVGDEFVFVAVGVRGPMVFADGQRVHEGRVWSALDRTEQASQERRELTARVGDRVDGPEIDRQLVEEDERRLVPEQLAERACSRCHVLFVTGADTLESSPPGQSVGQLTPRSLRKHTFFQAASVRGIGVLAIECRDTHGPCRKKPRVSKLLRVGDALHALCRMGQSDEAVCLTASV